MWAVVIDPKYGVVAAPQAIDDLGGLTVDALFAINYRWQDDIEAFTTEVAPDETAEGAAFTTALLLVILGHEVLRTTR